MAEKRLVKATPRALPLLLDIIDSTAYLYSPITAPEDESDADLMENELATRIDQGDYVIGFENHLPFGFVGIEKRDDCCRLIGPCLYRDYLGRGYGRFLLDVAGKLALGRELRLIYLTVHREAHWATSFFSRWGFEAISDDPEFISRWRDGLLADCLPGKDHLLMARLFDNPLL